MKTFVSIFYMFSVTTSCFNEGIFHSEVIQHAIMVDVFADDAISAVFSFSVAYSSPYIVPRRQKASLFFYKSFLEI